MFKHFGLGGTYITKYGSIKESQKQKGYQIIIKYYIQAYEYFPPHCHHRQLDIAAWLKG